jgi:beta-barrel assembly-enhancing protease
VTALPRARPVVAALLLAAATTGVVHAQATDCGREERVARATAARIEREWPLRPDDAVTEWVRRVGRRLADGAPDSPYPWSFTVVRDRSANAFAIGGGVVYVHDGTIVAARNEAEVAAVLAHEMGHELAGHFCDVTGWAGRLGDLFAAGPSDGRGIGSMRQTIDPAREHAADRLSIPILAAAGYDPRAALDIARRSGRDRRSDDLLALLRDVPRRGALDLDRAAFDAVRRQLRSEQSR